MKKLLSNIKIDGEKVFINIHPELIKNKPYTNFKSKTFDNKVLISTDYGSWDFLSKKEYNDLKKIDKNTQLKERLYNKALIIDKNNLNRAIELTRKKYNYLFNGTSLHIVVPTLRCNHNCAYCHSRSVNENSNGFDMDKETAKKTVDFIFQTPAKRLMIEFQGGEPLLNFDVVKFIIEYAQKVSKEKDKQCTFDLVTNLSRMNHRILKFLMKNHVKICTSLDGPEHVHNKNRGYLFGNSYKNTIYWIKEIKEKYNYDVNALLVITKYSLPYHKEIIDEYVKNKLKIIKIKELDKIGYAKDSWKEIGYSSEEYVEFWKKSMEYLSQINKKYELRDRMVEYLLLKLKGEWPNYSDLQSPCGAVVSQIAYSQNGDIYTCDEGRQNELFRLGNVKTNSYKDVITSNKTCEVITASTNDNNFCDKCVYKPFCGLCPVCNFAETGDLTKKSAKNTRCKIYQGMFDCIFYNISQNNDIGKMFLKWVSLNL